MMTTYQVFNPVPLFETFGITRASVFEFKVLYILLLIVLFSTIWGKATRFLHSISIPLIFLVFGNILSLSKAADVAYVFHSRNVILFYLTIMTFFPKSGLRSILKLKDIGTTYTYNYPISIATISLGISYFGAAYCRLVSHGLSWMDGHTLQAYILEHYILLDFQQSLILSSNYWLCLALSILMMFFEISFVFLVFFKRTRMLYIISGLIFHLAILYFMNINFFKYHCLAFLVFLDWDWIRDCFRRFSHYSKTDELRSRRS
jgi:hypothetical protein